jgi:hypothetical protein
MLIPVLYKNEKLGMVYPNRLEELIASGEIVAFRRSQGWVFLGEDRIRTGKDGDGYAGTERRAEAAIFESVEELLEDREILYDICLLKK